MTIIKKVLNCDTDGAKIVDALNNECVKVFRKQYKRMPTMMEQRSFALGAFNVIDQLSEYLKKEL